MSASTDRVRDTRRPRVSGENVSSTETSAVNAFSAQAKDPRRATVVARQSAELDYQYAAASAADNLEFGPPSFHPQTAASKHFRKPHPSRHSSSSLDSHQTASSDSRSSGHVPPSYSSHTVQGFVRPLSIPQKSPYQSVLASEKVRNRKDPRVVVGDGRHLKQPVGVYSRGVPGGELPPTSEVDKGNFALGVGKPSVSGPVASASWEHMQREVEHLRKTVQEFHKVSRKQAKRIEELTSQSTLQQKVIQDKEQEINTLREKSTKFEKHLSSVENAIQCQICMDLPEKPYTLAPCGHVLCLTCLQEWFKTSLGPVDDDHDEAEENDVLNRDKTCPSCRTVVRHRPCPAFMVKEVISTFAKATTLPQVAQAHGADNTDDDPWAGIFPNSDDEGQYGIDDFSDDEDDFAINFPWLAERGRTPGFSTWTYGSDSEGAYSEDDDNDQGEAAPSEGTVSDDDYGQPLTYVEPRWEPPTGHVEPNSDPSEANDNALSLLRRGCTQEMVQNFHIRYSHRHGIIVTLRSIDDLYISDDEFDSSDEEGVGECAHHIFLGWNINLDEDDVDGEAFMHSMLADIKESPERWRLVPRYDGQGSMDVTRLVPAENRDDYSTTDTEIYLEHDEHDLDID